MKKVLLVVSTDREWWMEFARKLESLSAGKAHFEVSVCEEMLYFIDGEDTFIKDMANGYDVADFDLVSFWVGNKRKEFTVSIAAYCRKKGVKYTDPDYIPRIGRGKLDCSFVRWEHGIKVPKTAFGSASDLVDNILPKTGLPVVLKATNASKGRNNYLVNSHDEMHKVITENPDYTFILNGFIPNDGDYRFVVLGHKIRLVIKRTGVDGSHLNNTSQGGSAEIVDISEFDDNVKKLVVDSTHVDQVDIAGVDLIRNKETGEFFILEVNHLPQIASGSFVDEKTLKYQEHLMELLDEEN